MRRTNKKGAVYFDLSNCRSLDVKCAVALGAALAAQSQRGDVMSEMSETERAMERDAALEELEAAADGDDAPTLDMASVAALLRAQVEGRLQEMEERRAAQSGEAKSEL